MKYLFRALAYSQQSVLVGFFVVLLVGCNPERIISELDVMLFQRFGITLMTHLDKVTIKEIHLDNTAFNGRNVVIEGKYEEIAKYKTYLVISDDTSSKMIVNLSNIYNSIDDLSGKVEKGSSIKIWGKIETAQKGLPFVRAMSVNYKL